MHWNRSFTETAKLYGSDLDKADANYVIDTGKDNQIAILVAEGLKTKIVIVDAGVTERKKENLHADEGIIIMPKHAQFQIFETDDGAVDNSWDVKTRANGTFVLALTKSSSIHGKPSNIWIMTESWAKISEGSAGYGVNLKQVSSHLQWMIDAPKCKTEAFKWKAKDGTDLDGVVYYPPGKDKHSGPLPTIMLIHGGKPT